MKRIFGLFIFILLFSSCDTYFKEVTTFDTIGGCDYMIVTGYESTGEIQFKSFSKLDCGCVQQLKNTVKEYKEPRND